MKREDRDLLAFEEKSPASPTSGQGPTIGLALGGGAARGWAHIGVIKVLHAAGYRPQIITGTSIGAVVGGCYACGKLGALEDWVRSLTRRSVFSLMDVSLGGAGLISGNRLRRLLDHNLRDQTIEDLPCRFAAIATEIGPGHEIWLTRGRLVDAMRASYALPGVFEPVRIGGRWLMDGALVNPVPVSAARALGSRLMIAVNLHADVYGRGTVVASHGPDDTDAEHRAALVEAETRPRMSAARAFLTGGFRRRGLSGPPGIPTVMMEAFNVTQDRISRARLAGDPPDVSIGPKLAKIGLYDFHRAAETIDIGREAAERMLEPLAEAFAALT